MPNVKSLLFIFGCSVFGYCMGMLKSCKVYGLVKELGEINDEKAYVQKLRNDLKNKVRIGTFISALLIQNFLLYAKATPLQGKVFLVMFSIIHLSWLALGAVVGNSFSDISYIKHSVRFVLEAKQIMKLTDMTANEINALGFIDRISKLELRNGMNHILIDNFSFILLCSVFMTAVKYMCFRLDTMSKFQGIYHSVPHVSLSVALAAFSVAVCSIVDNQKSKVI